MDPINNVSQLVEVLRKRLVEADSRVSSTARKSAHNTKAAINQGHATVEDLQRKIRDKVRQIDANDPKARQKSVQVLLESILVFQFGERLMDDPKFYSLLDDIRLTMESDPSIKENLDQLILAMR